jgi:hypothetical protein
MFNSHHGFNCRAVPEVGKNVWDEKDGSAKLITN